MKFDPYGAYIKCHVNILTFNMYELFTINMLYFLEKIVIFTPLPPYSGQLSRTATFFSPQGDRRGEVRLYSF